MELQHFSHQHPLIFTEDHKEDDEDRCNGCLQLLSGPSYTCHIMHCNFHLHKSCAELSPHMNHHPIHPEHPLTLLAKPPHPHLIRRCYACQERWTGFAYSCSICDFNIDTVCAQKPQIIKHASHKHPLTPLRRTALFSCDACGLEHGGISYLCNTCQFWIHQSCASLPDTVKHFDHDHPLALCYSFPQEYYYFVFRCDICSDDLDKACWTYFCAGCRFFAHLNCATSQKEQSGDEETEIGLEGSVINPIPLPVTDESVDPIAYFLNLGQNERTEELNHCSHDHPLVLFDAQIDEFCSETKPTLLKKTKNNKTCNGCVQSISVPFYHCAQCRFFLHKSCAELPTEVKHPCHPEHPLTLLTKNPSYYGIFQCEACRTHCNGFAYKCNSCAFYLDARCGSLPGAIRHEAHKHPLLLTKKLFSRCNACHVSCPKSTFGCETCDFNLHIQCALLPGIIRHRYDKHPFVLNYFPVKDHLDEYYSEICCEELNPKCWFYHCGECDQSIHCGCISLVDEFSNIKFGGTLQVDGHSHLLTFFRKTKGDSKCDYCGEQINLLRHLAFECAQCDFKLHSACALK